MTMVRIDIEPVSGTGNQRYRVVWEGGTLVARARDPEHEAARALQALGISGLMQTFVRGTASMVLDIARVAKCMVVENSRGLRVMPWRPIDPIKRDRLRLSHAGLRAQTAKRANRATTPARNSGRRPTLQGLHGDRQAALSPRANAERTDPARSKRPTRNRSGSNL